MFLNLSPQSVEFHYRGADTFTNATLASVDALTDMVGDSIFVSFVFDWLRRLVSAKESTRSSGARYLYVLDHDFLFNQQGPISGAHHADDLFLQFDQRRPAAAQQSLLHVRQSAGGG